MQKYIILIIGLLMLIGNIIYIIYKIAKYNIKVEATLERFELERIRPFLDEVQNSCRRTNIYIYSYNGIIYYYRIMEAQNKYTDMKVGATKKIRISNKFPQKVYTYNPLTETMYLFFTLIVIIIGIVPVIMP